MILGRTSFLARASTNTNMRNCSCSSVASDADGPGDHAGDLREESHAVAAARRKHEKRVEAKAKEDLAAASGLPAPSSPSPLHHSNASPSKMTVEEAKAARDNLRFWEVHARKQLRRARMHERSFVEARIATRATLCHSSPLLFSRLTTHHPLPTVAQREGVGDAGPRAAAENDGVHRAERG